MDLKNLSYSKNSQPCYLKHPVTGDVLKNDDGKPFTLFLLGTESQPYKLAARELLNKSMEAQGLKQKSKTDFDIEAFAMNKLTSCTEGWENIVFDGQDYPFTPSNCQRLYNDFSWIQSQALAFIENSENFFAKP